ncbi:MAG: hypothetical protein AAF215_01470 [Cyanobacteria bacterium P01_A01_bin.123]
MYFPLWQYLNQPLWDSSNPPIFNPVQYWQRYKMEQFDHALNWQNYKIRHLNRCLNNASLEYCWKVSYQDFVVRYSDFCERHGLEEDNVWRLERCWQCEQQGSHTFHPENDISETEP